MNANCITGYTDYLYNRIQKSIRTATSIDINSIFFNGKWSKVNSKRFRGNKK